MSLHTAFTWFAVPPTLDLTTFEPRQNPWRPQACARITTLSHPVRLFQRRPSWPAPRSPRRSIGLHRRLLPTASGLFSWGKPSQNPVWGSSAHRGMGPRNRVLLCSREDRAHPPDQEKGRALSGGGHLQWNRHEAIADTEVVGSGIRSRAPREGTRPASHQTRNQDSYCLKWTTTLAAGANETTLPILCHTHNWLCIDSLARPAPRQDPSPPLEHRTAHRTSPSPIGCWK
jgi:hypothetical protein